MHVLLIPGDVSGAHHHKRVTASVVLRSRLNQKDLGVFLRFHPPKSRRNGGLRAERHVLSLLGLECLNIHNGGGVGVCST